MSDVKGTLSDPLVRQRLFPEPGQIFAFRPVQLGDAVKDGLIVVDTNVLLIPYTTGRASLEQIRKTFESLTKERRLRVPAQVAREFAINRAEKLKILFQQLSRKRELSVTRSQYPLLEGSSEYAELGRLEAELVGALDAYRKAVGSVLDMIANWQWDDPVSQIYRELFDSATVVEADISRESILDELRYRQENRIPPGYKDAANEHSGVGDLLIWKTILKVGELESRHIIFVSGDEKTDWRYQSENKALYPRIELLEEYRIASKGKSLLMITFAELLEQFGASAPVVAEVRQEEATAALDTAPLESEPLALDAPLTLLSLKNYLYKRYTARSHAVSDYSELLHELKKYRIRTVNQLNRLLDRTEAAFEVSEIEDPATEEGLSVPYSDVGVVRMSLAIADDKYRVWKYRAAKRDFARWRRSVKEAAESQRT
ncbi:PIN-like domain-containing protein [uncultured Paludibaculum sp.]|uniref:PIN-like domain-containing protein n=1 Tax=uncultured Paludibaculum sp. TaxID=1765020 RepID=UPI002AABA7E0|nr:PIN-like domain-containing protein [uncultured Paludibaculum sp.]